MFFALFFSPFCTVLLGVYLGLEKLRLVPFFEEYERWCGFGVLERGSKTLGCRLTGDNGVSASRFAIDSSNGPRNNKRKLVEEW